MILVSPLFLRVHRPNDWLIRKIFIRCINNDKGILASPDQRINRKRSIQLRGIIYLYNIFVHTQTQTLFIKESSTQGPPVCWLHRLNESTSGPCTENSFFQAAVSEMEKKPLNSSHTAVFDIYMKKIKNKQSNTDLWKEESARKYLHQRSCNKYNFWNKYDVGIVKESENVTVQIYNRVMNK